MNKIISYLKKIKINIPKAKHVLFDTRDELDRFDSKQILAAIRRTCETVRSQRPECKIYFLTDVHLGGLPQGLSQISSLSEVQEDFKTCSFVVLFYNDEDYREPLELIKQKGGSFNAVQIGQPQARYIDKDKAAYNAMIKTRKDCLSGPRKFDRGDFENIMQAIEITRNLDGDYVEIGVYRGSSGLAALHYLEEAGIKRKCWFFDTFEGFVYKEAKESFDQRWVGTHKLWGKDETIEYISGMYEKFSSTFHIQANNICDDKLPVEIQRISVCNIDVDMYDAVLAALKKSAPLIVENGIMISEDYGHTPGLVGAHEAVREFLQTEQGKLFTPIYMSSGQMLMIKNAK